MMDRRHFIKSGSLLALPLILKSCDWIHMTPDFKIEVYSDAQTGHLLRQKDSLQLGQKIQTETLIVGGGMAGLSAACHLPNQDFLLCELSDQLGGTSSASKFQNTLYSQGAHYDLGYPSNYGTEVLEFLERLDIVSYQHWNDSWGFTDREHIIFNRSKNQCYDHGDKRKDVLMEGDLKDQFLRDIFRYKRKMPLPSRLIADDLLGLNEITFKAYVSSKLELTDAFEKQLNYHMKDDYGAGADQVSALAGIHYFMCRPYYDQVVELFSPPQGNFYFIQKMARQLPADQLLTNRLVSRIYERENGFEVEVIDAKKGQIDTIICDKIIYAGQKHALKYVYPEQATLFADTSYAPWMVVNVMIGDGLKSQAFWQNEMLTQDHTFLGFVDSAAQHRSDQKIRTLTGYYCLPSSSRKDLLNVEANKAVIAQNTIKQMSDYFNQDISDQVLQVSIKVMGHAMPIPQPGYLFDDKNHYRKNKKIAFAGVDNSRLPLMYEAIDSGIMATAFLG